MSSEQIGRERTNSTMSGASTPNPGEPENKKLRSEGAGDQQPAAGQRLGTTSSSMNASTVRSSSATGIASETSTATALNNKAQQTFDVFNVDAYPPHTEVAAQYVRDTCGPQVNTSLFEYVWNDATAKATGDWAPSAVMRSAFQESIQKAEPPSDKRKALALLNERLNNNDDPGSMELTERSDELLTVRTFISFNSLLKSDKRGLLVLFSTRGSGKTQLLKKALMNFDTALAKGYVAVCDCGQTRNVFEAELHTLRDSERNEGDIDHFVISLIRKHVQSMLGKTFGDVETVADAFAAWKTLCTPLPFRPMIVFDTVESLPQATAISCTRSPRHRTILEAIAHRLPTSHGMIAFGSLRVGTGVVVADQTDVSVVEISPLPPLTLGGYTGAIASWVPNLTNGQAIVLPTAPTDSMRVFHMLSGGVPRLLRLSLGELSVVFFNYLESWGSVLKMFVKRCTQLATLTGDIGDNLLVELLKADKNKNTLLAMAALASGVRARVEPMRAVPFVSDVMWRHLQRGILYTDAEDCALVPPALLLDGDLHNVSTALADGKSCTCTVDNTLRNSWPPGLSLQSMHFPDSLKDLERLNVSGLSALKRGKPWEIMVAHCVVGRWFYLHLMSGTQQTAFPLSSVLNLSGSDGDSQSASDPKKPQPPDLSQITVDFSGGISKEEKLDGDVALPAANVFYLNSVPNGHHDAKFMALRADDSPIVVCVQMRHGVHKTPAELMPQLRKFAAKPEKAEVPDAGAPGDLVDLLLSIGSGPPSGGRFSNALLLERAVRIDGSRFSRPASLAVYDPAFLASEAVRQSKTDLQ